MSPATPDTTAPAHPIAEAMRDYLESDEFKTELEAERGLLELMAQIRDLADDERHEALVWWARSPYWGAPLMLCVGWQGKLARAAYAALKRDLEADTPGRRWNELDWKVGRASIARLLGLADSPFGFYATFPFRTWPDDDGRTWIAGAVGCEPLTDTAKMLRWNHLDIREVILWDPRTNEAQIAGEHRSTSMFILPDMQEQRVAVWGDCGAYFRAWAARRLRTAQLARMRVNGEWAHPIAEPADGSLPGWLLVGECLRARWPYTDASKITAEAGITVTELKAAAHRAARLPVFEGA